MIRATLRSAASVALVGGFLLGCREALLVLYADAFAQPGQYLWLYLAVPILAWIALASALLLPLGLLLSWRATAPGLWLYALVLGLAGAASILVPEVRGVEERLTAVGFSGSGPSWPPPWGARPGAGARP